MSPWHSAGVQPSPVVQVSPVTLQQHRQLSALQRVTMGIVQCKGELPREGPLPSHALCAPALPRQAPAPPHLHLVASDAGRFVVSLPGPPVACLPACLGRRFGLLLCGGEEGPQEPLAPALALALRGDCVF